MKEMGVKNLTDVQTKLSDLEGQCILPKSCSSHNTPCPATGHCPLHRLRRLFCANDWLAHTHNYHYAQPTTNLVSLQTVGGPCPHKKGSAVRGKQRPQAEQII